MAGCFSGEGVCSSHHTFSGVVNEKHIKNLYTGLMRIEDSLEETLMLGKIEGRRRRG